MSTANGVRYIYSRFGSRHVADLLQTIFAAEILRPSTRLWIVSPWISDIPVLDNRANTFSSLAPEWARSRIHLSVVLEWLLGRGTIVHVATRGNEDHNRDFINRIENVSKGRSGMHLHLSADLHDKGILGDGYHLAGSMNLTHSGISINDEVLQFTTDSANVASHQVAFRARWKE